MPLPRVLLAAESLGQGANGIGRVARLTAKVLAEQARAGALEVRAIALRDETPPDLDLPVTVFRGSRARFVVECQRAALRCTHFVYDFAGMARAHPRWMRPLRRSLVWVHGIEAWERARPDRLAVFARTDVLVTNTAYTRERANAAHGGFLRAHTCWLGTETDTEPAQSTLRAPNVLLLGRIDEHGGEKGHRELIECWPDVVREIPNARLRFAGAGPGEPIVREWIAASPAREHIELLGFVPEEALPPLWADTSVLAMPSRCEGFGIAYLDAMRHGVPILASIHDAAAEVNVHDQTGWNVALDRPGELAARLCALLGDEALRARLGAAGRERWREQFRYSAFRDRFLPILNAFLHEA